jgi:hypothetical protein
LIDIGKDLKDNVSLVITTETQLLERRYLALSHCWGSTMPTSAKLTLETLDINRKSIDLQGLPRTFQDFIEIARRLGVRYVWIDSLCIIQNSKEDWQSEAAQMASVYSGAYLTIAASSSADGRGGCHVIEGEKSYGPVDIDALESTNNGADPIKPSTRRFRVWTRGSAYVSLKNDPLTRRGWTLQEVRIIFSSNGNIFFRPSPETDY